MRWHYRIEGGGGGTRLCPRIWQDAIYLPGTHVDRDRGVKNSASNSHTDSARSIDRGAGHGGGDLDADASRHGHAIRDADSHAIRDANGHGIADADGHRITDADGNLDGD
ncbi:MAG: hypothetical protein F4X02_08275 [Chloroflexi bacterium]|nr:hypothetical protein [Chloroflexota bacterium]